MTTLKTLVQNLNTVYNATFTYTIGEVVEFTLTDIKTDEICISDIEFFISEWYPKTEEFRDLDLQWNLNW